MSEQKRVTAEEVRALAAAADLPLDPKRAEEMADRLADWLTAANELSEKMSVPVHLPQTPITSVTHPLPEQSE